MAVQDSEEFAAWLQGFDLTAKQPDIDALVQSNALMAELQSRIVPVIVDFETFWTRYFYQLHQLQAKHEQRLQVGGRTMPGI